MDEHTWCEVDRAALEHNIGELRAIVGEGPTVAPVVKANAYGHGMEIAAQAFLAAGADWLCVNALYEARRLRDLGLDVPLYVMGHVDPEHAEEAIALGCDIVVYDPAVVDAAAAAAAGLGRGPARLHLKLETGNNRQGLRDDQALELARHIHAARDARLAGLATHFADVEDTTDHTFARHQRQVFHAFVDRLAAEGIRPERRHVSNSAATILWPDVHMDLVRAGIACYGMWPSTESYVSAVAADRARCDLRPALTWKSRVAQIRSTPAGEYVGYGRTYRTTHTTSLAVVPVGYYDGYSRSLSNLAHVLVRGCRAPVRGRVCMNMIMIDTTHIPDARPGDEVVLLGRQGDEWVTAEQMAGWADTINYEITTCINERIPRVEV